MNIKALPLLTLLFTILLAACGGSDNPVASSSNETATTVLNGTWNASDASITVSGNSISWQMQSGGITQSATTTETASGTFAIDTSTSPARIDITITAYNGSNPDIVVGNTYFGIFTIDNGALIIQVDFSRPSTRPTAFDPQKVLGLIRNVDLNAPFEGTWTGTDGTRSCTVSVSNNVFDMKIYENGQLVDGGKGAISFNQNTIPKEFDICIIDVYNASDTANIGKKILGIYQLIGNSLTIALGSENGPRPASFVSDGSTEVIVLSF
jgi:uncharacterized protein (TIGR03067 family)